MATRDSAGAADERICGKSAYFRNPFLEPEHLVEHLCRAITVGQIGTGTAALHGHHVMAYASVWSGQRMRGRTWTKDRCGNACSCEPHLGFASCSYLPATFTGSV